MRGQQFVVTISSFLSLWTDDDRAKFPRIVVKGGILTTVRVASEARPVCVGMLGKRFIRQASNWKSAVCVALYSI